MPEGIPLLMDKAYEDNETRQLVLDLGMIPVVPPKSNRIEPWDYDRALYKKRNEIEQLFRRLKGFPHLLTLRKARRRIPRLPKLRTHCRSAEASVNTP
jgi:transposase